MCATHRSQDAEKIFRLLTSGSLRDQLGTVAKLPNSCRGLSEENQWTAPPHNPKLHISEVITAIDILSGLPLSLEQAWIQQRPVPSYLPWAGERVPAGGKPAQNCHFDPC